MFSFALILSNFNLDGGMTVNNVKVRTGSDSTIIKKIIEHHLAAFKENDLDAIITDYSEKSIIFKPNKTYHGLQEIRDFFKEVFINYPKNGTTIILDKLIAEANVGYIIWHGETPGQTISFSTSTYIIEDGKILRHTIGRVVKNKE